MGRLISFSGIDGAGKSTQVKLLSQKLKKDGYSVCVTERMFSYFFLKPIIKHLRKATKSPTGGPVTRNNKFLLKLWFIPAFFDIWASFLFRDLWTRRKYDFVIADRYYTDIWANLLYYGYLPPWGFKPFLKLLPQADIALVFEVNPKNVRKREDDFPLSYYVEQAKIYHGLKSQIDCNLIDANSTPDVVLRNVTKLL